MRRAARSLTAALLFTAAWPVLAFAQDTVPATDTAPAADTAPATQPAAANPANHPAPTIPDGVAPRQVVVDEESMGKVAILAPTEEPKAFVALLSDASGLTPAYFEAAKALVAAGAAVEVVDTQNLIHGLALGDEVDCHYAFGDMEDAARSGERALGMTTWRWPVLLGLGELGGTLAYLGVAQAPLNTAGGAVSLGFADHFASKLKLCGGAAPVGATAADGVWTYQPMAELPAPWTLVQAAVPDATAKTFLDASKGTKSQVVAGDDAARLTAAVQAALEMGAPPTDELGDLPLIELPTETPPVGLAVFISGDGGWRDIDKTIGEILQKEGVAVVGVDSLRYFWSEKKPEVVASDLGRIIGHYTRVWGAKRVAVIGYSLGADIVPLAWPKMTPALQRQINLLALLGLEPTADFQITVAGWLGVASSSDIDLRPSLPGLPMAKTMCFYGHDEVTDNETACTFPAMSKATNIERPGGHHFDGNYEPVARMILDRLKS